MTLKKLAVFDFDNTLVNFQSADPFVDFCLVGKRTFFINAKDFFRKILLTFKLLRGVSHKKFKLSLLKGLPEDHIKAMAKKYVEEVIVPNVNKKILDRLKEHRKNGDTVIIISGSYQPYLNFFSEQFGVEAAIGAPILFEEGVCQGEISGLNPLGKSKVKLLADQFDLTKFNLNESTAYSDDRSDLPLLQLVGHGVIVSHAEKVEWNASNEYELIRI